MNLRKGFAAGQGLALQDSARAQLGEDRQVRWLHQAVGVPLPHKQPTKVRPFYYWLVCQAPYHLCTVAYCQPPANIKLVQKLMTKLVAIRHVNEATLVLLMNLGLSGSQHTSLASSCTNYQFVCWLLTLTLRCALWEISTSCVTRGI